ncbi:hypothetical protein [Ktedonospora formicarum]|uniref:HAMP domain-containing protein n=1 Tax=Ktedonospora formicarum TaxID=2778364 RepID=A0A8J3IBN0_9CHLR|nr:hypothetical protein [Ktedonospora formicarum]GHO48399.1 hypothetical protein KSX_65620 [Ktedonospora formicarum]
MKRFMAWWYALSLPKRGPDKTPGERERTRYAQLTSSFLLLISVIFVPLSPIMIFFSPKSPSSPPIGIAVLIMLSCSFIFGKMGWNYVSAAFLVGYNLVCIGAVLATNPLDPSLLPLYSVFTIAIILAGALMPPISSLIVGVLCCIIIALLSMFVPHTAAYQQMLDDGLFTVTLIVPITLQLIVGAMTFAIMRNMINTIRRADRAEEIVSLQQELAQHVRTQMQQKQQLEEGFQKIAETHARISNGDLTVRVNLSEGHMLWHVAGSLNNLLNRMQRMKSDSDMLVATRQAAYQVSNVLHQAVSMGRLSDVRLPTTGTPLDSVIIELNNAARNAVTHSLPRYGSTSEPQY